MCICTTNNRGQHNKYFFFNIVRNSQLTILYYISLVKYVQRSCSFALQGGYLYPKSASQLITPLNSGASLIKNKQKTNNIGRK